jgi:putative transcriptional regulator
MRTSTGDLKVKNKIKVFRAMHNLTQEKLAQALGVTRQTILAIEKEKYDPSLSLAFRIAYYFNVKIEDIFTYTHDELEQVSGASDTDLPWPE